MDASGADFSRSSIAWSVPHDPKDTRLPGRKPWGNNARILIDARCKLIDTESGATEEFF